MKRTIILLAFLVGLECQSQTLERMDKQIGTVEIVQFKLKAGIDASTGKEKLLQLNQCVQHFDGFIERKLTVNEAGEWMDIVYWTSKQAAMNAAELVAKDPKALESFAVIDESTMVMNHFNLVETFQH